jgi:hypothetical protein
MSRHTPPKKDSLFSAHNSLEGFNAIMFIFVFFSLSFWVQVGLKGEESGLSSGSTSQWVSQPTLPKNQPLTWYKVT